MPEEHTFRVPEQRKGMKIETTALVEGLQAELLVQLRVFLILRISFVGPLRRLGVGGRWGRAPAAPACPAPRAERRRCPCLLLHGGRRCPAPAPQRRPLRILHAGHRSSRTPRPDRRAPTPQPPPCCSRRPEQGEELWKLNRICPRNTDAGDLIAYMETN